MKVAIYDSQFLSSVGIETVLKNISAPYSIDILNTERQLIPQLNSEHDLLILEYVGEYVVSADILKEVKRKFSNLKVLIISEDDDTIEIKRRIALGVEGFLTKKCSLQEIQLTIDTINKGGRFYCRKIIDMMADHDTATTVDLSERELQIVQMIGKGIPSSEMADKLNLSIHTINSHRKNILKKLRFKSPAELIAYAVKKMG